MKPSMLSMLSMLIVLVPGCGVERHAAETAMIEVESDYEHLRERMTTVAPDQAQSVEVAITSAKEALDQNDAKTALRLSGELKTRLRDLSERLPAMQAELEAAWKTLDSSVPGTLTTLGRKLNRANRPPAGRRQAAFDAARVTLSELKDQWAEAQLSRSDGRLADAVAKAEDIRNRAAGLASETHDGS